MPLRSRRLADQAEAVADPRGKRIQSTASTTSEAEGTESPDSSVSFGHGRTMPGASHNRLASIRPLETVESALQSRHRRSQAKWSERLGSSR